MSNPIRWAAVAFALALSLGAAAQTFPSHPITIIVGYAPGGSNDIMARLLQPKLSERLGVPVVVENRPGADGVIGTTAVAKSAPDGHTLLLTWDAHVVNAIVKKDLPFDIWKDFAPVSLVGRFPLILVTNSEFPAKNVGELVKLGKEQPGKLDFASVGASSSTRLHAENFVKLAGIQAVHVPYKGAGPSVVALMRNEVSFSFLSYAAVKGQLDAGKLKALAVTGEKRLAELPDTSTMAESGFGDGQGYSWLGIYAPAGRPPAVVKRLSDELRAVVKDPEVQKAILANGVEPIGSTPEELDRYVHSEYEKWSRFVQGSHLTFE